MPRGGERAPQEVFHAVWRRRWTVVWTLLLCVGAAVAYLALATPVFTATSRLYVTPDVPSRGGGIALPERSKNYLNTQCELLKSTPILGPVAGRPDISAMTMFAQGTTVASALKDQLNVELGNKDDLIEVSLDSTDAEDAARVVNAVVDSYVAYQSARRRTSATEMLRILRKEKEARERELADHRMAVLKFKQDNSVLALQSDRGAISLQRLAQLSEARTAAQLHVAEAAAAYEVTRGALSDPTRRRELAAALADDGTAPGAGHARAALQGELYQNQLKLGPVRRQLGPNHPTVLTLTSSIVEAERKLNDLDVEFVKARLTSLEQALLAAKTRLAAIDDAFQEQRKEALELNATAARLAVLESGVDQAQKLVEGIGARMKELGVEGETGALNVTVLESAVAAAKPSKPRKPLVLLASGMLGLLVGSCLAFVRLSTDRRLRSTDQVEEALGAPVLSAVPRIRRRLRLGAGPAGAAAAPGSGAADAFRTIRTAIYFGNLGEAGKTLVVTSAVKGEGKSTLAANLAAAMAHAGERVLLVDADLRRPSLDRAFKVDNQTGLSSVLDGGAGLCDAVRATEVERLDLLTSGPIPSNPTELLGGGRFGALLAQLSKGYDRIVLDAPPVLGMADALILGARCDATLLVVRLDVSDRGATQAAFAALVNIGVRSIATVVNAVRDRHAYAHYSRRHSFAGRHCLISGTEAEPRGPVKAPVRVVGDERRRAVNGAATCDDAKRPDAPPAAPASAVRVEPQRALATSHSRRKDPFNGGI